MNFVSNVVLVSDVWLRVLGGAAQLWLWWLVVIRHRHYWRRGGAGRLLAGRFFKVLVTLTFAVLLWMVLVPVPHVWLPVIWGRASMARMRSGPRTIAFGPIRSLNLARGFDLVSESENEVLFERLEFVGPSAGSSFAVGYIRDMADDRLDAFVLELRGQDDVVEIQTGGGEFVGYRLAMTDERVHVTCYNVARRICISFTGQQTTWRMIKESLEASCWVSSDPAEGQ